jgi:hypothetical protein
MFGSVRSHIERLDRSALRVPRHTADEVDCGHLTAHTLDYTCLAYAACAWISDAGRDSTSMLSSRL